MNNKTEAIIIDIDGTLSDCSHRLHHIEGAKQDWDAFYDAMDKDKVNLWCAKIINEMMDHKEEFWRERRKILFVTGRPEKYREITIDWMKENMDEYIRSPLDNLALTENLFMRKNGDYRPDWKVKREIYIKSIKDKYDVIFCIDDRLQVVRMWRNLGLVCLQCAEIIK